MTRYKNMSAEEFVDYMLDESGLAAFVEEQFHLLPTGEWAWQEVALRISHLSEKQWQPSAEYVAGLYAMQKQRALTTEAREEAA